MNIYKARFLLSEKYPDFTICVHEDISYSRGEFNTMYSFTMWNCEKEYCFTSLTAEQLKEEVERLCS